MMILHLHVLKHAGPDREGPVICIIAPRPYGAEGRS